MKKRTRIALAAAVVTAFALTACSGGAGGSGGGPVTLTYWSGFTGGDKKAYQDLIAEFNKTHTDVQVKYELQPWDSIAQKLPTAIASGSGPDIATPDYNVATVQQYANNDLAAPLDLIGSGKDQIASGVLPKTVTDAFTIKGKLYAAPANYATLLLYYNADLLKAAGYSEPPKTMDELKDYAAKLSDGNGQYGIALPDNNTIATWPILIWADGGDVVSSKGCSALGSSKTVGTVESWSSLIRDKKITPTGLAGQDADNLFAAGKAAMEINGPWAGGGYTKAGVNWKVAPVPVGSSGDEVTLASTVPMIVNAKSQHQKEAQVFLSWWLGKKAQAQLSTSAAYAPSRTDMNDDSRITGDATVAAFTEQVPNARLWLPTEKDFTKIDTDIFQPAIQSATQNADASAALEKANDQLKSLLGC